MGMSEFADEERFERREPVLLLRNHVLTRRIIAIPGLRWLFSGFYAVVS
jgi:hypothetical protein